MRLWRACRGADGASITMAGGVLQLPAEGLRHLPSAGGLLDQCAWLMDAFDHVAAAWADARSRRR